MALADFRNSIITQDRFSATFRKFDQGVASSAKGLDKMGSVISGVGALFGATAGAAGLVMMGKAALDLSALGAQSLTTKASFESLMRAVGQSPALLDRLSMAADGTISEMTLMQQANSALAGTSGALSREMAAALPRLLEAGRAAAKLNPAYGDAAFMFQSLVSGVKRGTPMLIDNTGITLKLGEATEAYAASVGKSVTDLTSQERSIAILRATLAGANTLIEQAGGATEDYAADMQRAKVAVDELKTALGEMLAPHVATAASSLADALRDVRAALEGDDEGVLTGKLRVAQQVAEYYANYQARTPAEQDWAAKGLAQAQLRVRELEHAMLTLTSAEHRAAAGATVMAAAQGVAGAATADYADRLAGVVMTANAITGALADATSRVAGLSAAMQTGSFTGFLGGVDVLSQAQYVTLTQQRIGIDRALNVQVAAGILTQQQADYQLATFDKRVNDHIGSLRTVTAATGSYAGKLDDLKSRIGSALTPTFDLSGLTGGMLGGQAGNAFDEAYKRLAAVALRPEELQIHAGDWADTFEQAGLTGLTPEDAQARARELVDAYAKGLDFSLIDKEAIKDSVRQAIRAEELYQSIVDEIYAEMGKENNTVQRAGYSLGRQIGKATTQALRDLAPDAVNAMANAVAPSVAAIIRRDSARYEQ